MHAHRAQRAMRLHAALDARIARIARRLSDPLDAARLGHGLRFEADDA